MAKISPEQLKAAEMALRPYISDKTISVAGLFLEALDAYMAAGPEKRRKVGAGAKKLPDGIPTAEQKQTAVRSWESVGRHDLAARVSDIAEEFRNYHIARGSTMESWGHAWATWYKRSIKIERPTGQPALVLNMFDDATASGWVSRLETFFGLGDMSRWTWRKTWGPNPFEPNNKVPESVKRQFSAEHRNLDFKALRAEYEGQQRKEM